AEGRRLGLWPHLAVLMGALALTVLLGVVNGLTGGRFLFFLPQIKYTLFLTQGNSWYLPADRWLPWARRLALPVATPAAPAVAWWGALGMATLAGCAVTWLAGRPWDQQDGRRQALWVAALQVPFVFALPIACYYQFVKQQTVLFPPYMEACLIGPTVLALAV